MIRIYTEESHTIAHSFSINKRVYIYIKLYCINKTAENNWDNTIYSLPRTKLMMKLIKKKTNEKRTKFKRPKCMYYNVCIRDINIIAQFAVASQTASRCVLKTFQVSESS